MRATYITTTITLAPDAPSQATALDALALLQRADDLFQHDADHPLKVTLIRVRTLGVQLLHEFGLDH